MNNNQRCFSKLFYAIALLFSLSLTIGYTSIAEARQGCGYGYHFCYARGYCVPNGTICQQHWYHGGRYIPGTGRYIPGQ